VTLFNFLHILYKIAYKYYILIKLPEVKKKIDEMLKEYKFSLLSSLVAYSTINPNLGSWGRIRLPKL
jgi:hypothetical protein